MQGQLYLEFAGSFLTFFLQTAAACLVCVLFTRLLRHPRHRFLVWLLSLAASGLYWLRLLGQLGIFAAHPSALIAASNHSLVPARDHFLVPQTWSGGLGRLDELAGALYLAGMVWLAGSQVLRSVRLRALVRLGSQPSPALARLFESMLREFKFRRCKLLVLPGLVSPATVYWRTPCILLPESCDLEEATPRLANVLRHELVHIERRDYLVSAISDALCALLFFHPAVWYARKQMRLERELACDRAAVSDCPEHRANYADTLAYFVRLQMLQQQAQAPGVDFAGSTSFLSRRIRCILEEPANTPWWKKFSAATVGLALWMVFAFSIPGLAIVLDFTGRQDTAVKIAQNRAATMPAMVLHKLRSIAKSHSVKAKADDMADPVVLPDTLTSLRVHDRVPESSESFQVPQDDSSGGIAEGPDVTSPTWREQSPAAPSVSGPSARSIVIATLGGIAASERKEHSAGRGHER